MAFGSWLKSRREASGLTQAQFGERIGLSKSMVSAIELEKGAESGKAWRPQPEIVRAMVEALRSAGVPVTEPEAFREAGLGVLAGPSEGAVLEIDLKDLPGWTIQIRGGTLRLRQNGTPTESGETGVTLIGRAVPRVEPSIVASIDAGDLEAVEEFAAVPPT